MIDGVPAMSHPSCPKPLSVAIDELNSSKIHILKPKKKLLLPMHAEKLKKKEAEEMDEMVFSLDEEDDVEAEAAVTADEMAAEEERI